MTGQSEPMWNEDSLHEEGGVSHFRYGRDNVLLTWMHTRLVIEFIFRLPGLLWRKLRGAPPFQP